MGTQCMGNLEVWGHDGRHGQRACDEGMHWWIGDNDNMNW